MVGQQPLEDLIIEVMMTGMQPGTSMLTSSASEELSPRRVRTLPNFPQTGAGKQFEVRVQLYKYIGQHILRGPVFSFCRNPHRDTRTRTRAEGPLQGRGEKKSRTYLITAMRVLRFSQVLSAAGPLLSGCAHPSRRSSNPAAFAGPQCARNGRANCRSHCS